MLWDGYVWRQEQQENLFAYFTCQLMNISGKSLKHAINPKELLKPLRQPKMNKRNSDTEYLKKQFQHVLTGGEANV